MRPAHLIVAVALALALALPRGAFAQADAGPEEVVPPVETEPPPPAEGEPGEPPPPVEGEPQTETAADQPAPSLLCPVESRTDEPDRQPSGLADGSPLAGFEVRADAKDLHEAPEVVRAVLEPLLAQGAAYTAEREQCLFARLDKLKYRYRLSGKRQDGGLFLVIRLHPAVLVRRVDVDMQFGLVRGIFRPPVLEDDVRSRLRYREATAIPDDDREREAFFNEEAQRIEQWMARQGYFEARVAIYAEEDSEFEVILKVTVVPGPEYKLGKVRLEGNTSIIDEVILDEIDDEEWFGWSKARFTLDKLNQWLDGIRDLYHRSGFYGARVRSDFDINTSFDRATKRVNLTITISERKKIDVAFEGNESLPQEELEKVLTFNDEASFDDFSVQNSADAIRRRYQNDGYYQVMVSWERVRLLPTFERILFYIDEGPKQKVRAVTFLGNEHIPSERLSRVVSTRVYGRFSDGGYATPLQLEDDAESIAVVYRREGYSQVKVTVRVAPRRELFDDPGALAATVTSEQLGGSLYVRFEIDEGPRDTVAVINIVGNRTLNDRDVQNEIRLRPGGPFNPEIMEQDMQRIRDLYANKGFPYAEIASEAHPMDASGQQSGVFAVTFEIDEGPSVTVGPVLVRGNFKTKDWVIRDVLGLKKGQPLTITALRDGRDALSGMGLFSTVNLALLGLSPEEKYPVVFPLVEVQERYDNNGELQFGGGYRSDADFFLSGGYFYRNLWGVGASFSAEVLYSLRSTDQTQRAVEGNFRLPYWLMKRKVAIPLDLNLKAFYQIRQDERFGELTKVGGNVGLSRQLRRGLLVSLTYGIVRTTVNEDLVRGAGASAELDTIPVPTNTSSIGFNVILDRRKDRCGKGARPALIAPECGYKLTVAAEWTSSYLGGSEDFVKLGGSASIFTKLAPRVLLSNGLRFDYGIPLGGAVLLPETERFFSGGNTTVRGLEEDRAYTEVIESPLPPGGGVTTSIVRPAGGNIRFIYNVDVQVKVCNCFFGAPLAAAIFLDTGLVTSSFAHFGITQLRHSVGISLIRIVTSYLSASVEYAIPLDPGPGDDKTGRFHLNFGFVLN